MKTKEAKIVAVVDTIRDKLITLKTSISNEISSFKASKKPCIM